MDSKFYEAFSYVLYPLTIMLLIAVLIFGTEVNGAKSWIAIGSFRLQPAEFCKFTTNLALAKYITSVNFKFTRIKNLIIAGTIMLIPSVLILLQNDTGSALVYFAFILVFYQRRINRLDTYSRLFSGSLFHTNTHLLAASGNAGYFCHPNNIPLIKNRSWISLGIYGATFGLGYFLHFLNTKFQFAEIPLHYCARCHVGRKRIYLSGTLPLETIGAIFNT